jgi:hypothetical protein
MSVARFSGDGTGISSAAAPGSIAENASAEFPPGPTSLATAVFNGVLWGERAQFFVLLLALGDRDHWPAGQCTPGWWGHSRRCGLRSTARGFRRGGLFT